MLRSCAELNIDETKAVGVDSADIFMPDETAGDQLHSCITFFMNHVVLYYITIFAGLIGGRH